MNAAEHKLDKSYCFWVTLSDSRVTASEYEDAIKFIATFGTIEGFWQVYSYLKRPDDVPVNTDFHVFQEGIRPMWEDDANKEGARWVLRLKKGATSLFWEELLLCVIGEQFNVTDQICGVVVSMRQTEDIISIWIRSGQDFHVKNSIKETLKQIWNLPDNVFLEFKEHPTNARPAQKGRFNS